jgi:hypothetical protein
MNKIIITEQKQNKIYRKRSELNTIVIKKTGTKTTKVFTG